MLSKYNSMLGAENIAPQILDQIASVQELNSSVSVTNILVREPGTVEYDLQAYLFKNEADQIIYCLLEVTNCEDNEVTVVGNESILRAYSYYAGNVKDGVLEFWDWFYVRLLVQEIY